MCICACIYAQWWVLLPSLLKKNTTVFDLINHETVTGQSLMGKKETGVQRVNENKAGVECLQV